MPIYEYECRSCGHRFETMQKVSEAPLTDCPACSQPQLSKLVSAAGFRLKGGGWYETDFKSGGEKKRNLVGSGGDGKPSEGGGDGSKADKPATPAASTSTKPVASSD
ncbi:MAG: zinc ribbon domain-containing protein [Methylotetracoccus sp.]